MDAEPLKLRREILSTVETGAEVREDIFDRLLSRGCHSNLEYLML